MASTKNRLRVLSFLVLLAALLLTGRLYFVQIVSGEEFESKAESQYIAKSNYFDRGAIFFTAKDGMEVPAATIKTGFILHVNPQILAENDDNHKVFESINNIVEIDREDFFAKLGKTGDPYEELARRLPEEIAGEIKELNIPGVGVARERWRIYPGGALGSHVVGLIGYSGDELAGRYGLERAYEKTLARDEGSVFVNFFAEIFSNIKSVVSSEESIEGDIVTTIEPSVQAFVESELQDIEDRYASDFTGGIVINPQTGAIYAMALNPDFDPNFPQNESSSYVFKNRLVEDRYEMGSIVKALTAAIGIDSGAINAASTYNDPGCMTLNTKTFCNYDGKSHGHNLSMQIVLNKSLNTGAAVIASRMGTSEFNKRMLAFDFEGLTDIDLPNEGKSLVSNLRENRNLEAAQASFGQGIAMTPIATVRALSALANGGTLVTPYVVKEIKYKLGPSKVIQPEDAEDRERVLSEEASLEISRMLTEVVDRSLRNGDVRLENYSVAAKTGTAQIANPNGGGYYKDRWLHSFFGYFPSYDPEFLVFLYTYHPKGVQYASETLTQSFIDITKFLVNYYELPPDREASPPSRS